MLNRLNYLHSFTTKNKLNSHEKVCKSKDFYGIAMPSEKDNILRFNQYIKSDKMPYMLTLLTFHVDIYVNLESLINKVDGCVNNTEKSSATKIDGRFPCGYSMSAIWAFDSIENKHSLYREEDYVKKAKLTSRCKCMLHLRKKILKTIC